MIKNKDIIIIGSIDWKTNWQTQHRLVSSLVKQKNRVLYIENTGIRTAKISDFFSRIKKIELLIGLKAQKVLQKKKTYLYFHQLYFPFHL